MIRIVSGRENYIYGNHIVATTDDKNQEIKSSDSCFSAQVDALTSDERKAELSVVAVKVDSDAVCNVVLDSGSEKQVQINERLNVFRPVPAMSVPV